MIGFYDMETGGWSIDKNGICEIAMIAYDQENNKVVGEFHSFIKPYTRGEDTDELVSYKPDAMAVNGLTQELLQRQGYDVRAVCQLLQDFMTEHDITVLIGHCSKTFDWPRLKYLFQRFLGMDIFSFILQDDTHDMAKEKLKLPNYKLPTLCNHFGIVNEKEHSSLGDSYATLKVYQSLISL